jgi:hypothetical protein
MSAASITNPTNTSNDVTIMIDRLAVAERHRRAGRLIPDVQGLGKLFMTGYLIDGRTVLECDQEPTLASKTVRSATCAFGCA